MDEALRHRDVVGESFAEVAAFAVRVARAAERDEDSGHSDSWRRAHDELFAGGLAGRLEALAVTVGRSLRPVRASVSYADEVRDLARSASGLAAVHGARGLAFA